MYAKVDFVVERRDNTLVVPTNAVVDLRGGKGVFLPDEGDVARFQAVKVGMSQADLIEIVDGLTEGTRVVTTGAAALREGDRIVLLGANGRGGRGGQPDGSGAGAAGAGAPAGTAPSGGPGGQRGVGNDEGRGRRGGAPSTGQ